LFEIFHTERRTCTSKLLIQLDDVYLTINDNATQPFDYNLMVDEDLHINGIVGSFNVWDVFVPGPFIVTIVSG
jgi:hypothetical protein